jgi:hypothetical protein
VIGSGSSALCLCLTLLDGLGVAGVGAVLAVGDVGVVVADQRVVAVLPP